MVKNGFTLTELLITILIISIILSISYVNFGTIYKNYSLEGKLNGVTQNLLFLFIDARINSIITDSVICIKYENGTFNSFKDMDLDGNPDTNSNFLSSFSLDDKMKIFFNNIETNSFLIYTFDGVFFKNNSGKLDPEFSNSKIKIMLDSKFKILKIENSLPKIVE